MSHMDPLHLIATNDPEDENRPQTSLQKSLSRTLSRREDSTYGSLEGHKASPFSVYVDELSGSDTAGNGSPMQPYQSIKGALRNRSKQAKKQQESRPLAIFIKRRAAHSNISYWMPASAEAEKIAPIPLSKFKTVERSGEKEMQMQREQEAKQAAKDIEDETKATKKPGFLKRVFTRKE